MGTFNLSNPKTELLIKDILKDGFGTISGVLNTEKSELLSAKCKEILLTDYEFSGVSQQSPKTGEVYNNAKTRHTAYKTDTRNLIGISQTVDNLIEDIMVKLKADSQSSSFSDAKVLGGGPPALFIRISMGPNSEEAF